MNGSTLEPSRRSQTVANVEDVEVTGGSTATPRGYRPVNGNTLWVAEPAASFTTRLGFSSVT